jgi:hypothetical protein
MKFRRYRIFLDGEAVGEWVAPEMDLVDVVIGFRGKLEGFLRAGLEREINEGAKLTAKDVTDFEEEAA